MAGRKTNTQRIESLEEQAATFFSRLEVDKQKIEAAKERLSQFAKDTEQNKVAISEIEKELVAIKKDIDFLQNWKNDQKKEKEEVTRRFWSFWPSIAAAIISGIIALIGLALNLWLNRPR